MVEGPHRAETPEGHVANVREREVSPLFDHDNEVEVDRRAPPNPWLEKLRA
jgi:hypothetical protein